MSDLERVLERLKLGRATRAQLAEELGVNADAVSKTLWTLKLAGLVRAAGGGVWALPAHEEMADEPARTAHEDEATAPELPAESIPPGEGRVEVRRRRPEETQPTPRLPESIRIYPLSEAADEGSPLSEPAEDPIDVALEAAWVAARHALTVYLGDRHSAIVRQLFQAEETAQLVLEAYREQRARGDA